LIGWGLVAGFIVTLGVCACVLPAVYLYAVFTLLPVVVAVERSNAIRRCFQLFHHDLGAAAARIATILAVTAGVGLATSIVNSIVNAATGLTTSPFGVPGPAYSQDPGTVVIAAVASSLVSAVLAGAVAVLTAPMTLTAYADLRARREGASGPMLAGELGIRPAEPQG
jgi:hypothetical protein